MRTNLIKIKELPKVVESSTTDGMLDKRNSKEDEVRLVNINTIKQLIFNGVKYVVE